MDNRFKVYFLRLVGITYQISKNLAKVFCSVGESDVISVATIFPIWFRRGWRCTGWI